MNMRTLIATSLITGAALTLSGCPTAPGTYAVWLVNTSDSFTVTNLKVVDTEDPANLREYPDDIAPNTTRVINNLPLGAFQGRTIRVEIDGEGDGEIFNDGDFDVTIPDAVESGSVYVIAVRGNNTFDFAAEYVPLDDASKGALILKGYMPPIN